MRSSHALSQPELRHRYNGNGDVAGIKPMVKRRVSRVESLRNLFFSRTGGNGNGGQQGAASSGLEARKRFLLKKRARSAEKEKVRLAVGIPDELHNSMIDLRCIPCHRVDMTIDATEDHPYSVEFIIKCDSWRHC